MMRFMVSLITAAMVLSTAGAASAMTIYEVVGSINPEASGNVMDLASSGVADTALGATYPKAVVFSGSETLITQSIKNTAGVWVILYGLQVSNSVTKELVDAGTVNGSMNGYKKIMNAWGSGTANVMVIGGQDRYQTRTACKDFAADLRAGKQEAQLTGTGPITHKFDITPWGTSAMPTGTQIWRTSLPDNTGTYNVEGSVLSSDEEILVKTIGTAQGNADTISIDMEQKPDQTQQIKYSGDLKVGSDRSLTGILTGTFSGKTGFGNMQNGLVTMTPVKSDKINSGLIGLSGAFFEGTIVGDVYAG